MRPITKLPIGTEITLDDGTKHIIKEKYNPYQDAKDPLCINLGQYCVYCEAPFAYTRGLDVEHILPKDPALGYSHLKYDWNNFLIGCPTCNGRGNKENKIELPENCHFPHLNNTYLSLKYDKGGVVIVNPELEGKSYQKALRLLNLVGLDKSPADSSQQDKRWQYRIKEWDFAERYKDRYENGKCDLDCLIDYIKVSGCWSIWYTVFSEHDEVKKRMISDFPGTAIECFDSENHYYPVARNPGNEDTV